MALRESTESVAQAPQDLLKLLARAKDGDVSAFETIYRRCVGRVYALCLRMTGDCALAEDCAQETFVKAWRKLRDFRGDASLTTWLHRIAVNEVLTLQRRAGRETRYLESVGSDSQTASVQPRSGEAMDIEAAILRLPEGARNVFVLCGIHGYQHKEAAEFLGLAPGTCKAQLHRARRLLKTRLAL